MEGEGKSVCCIALVSVWMLIFRLLPAWVCSLMSEDAEAPTHVLMSENHPHVSLKRYPEARECDELRSDIEERQMALKREAVYAR